MTSSAGRIIRSVANFLTCTHVARWLSLPSSPSQPPWLQRWKRHFRECQHSTGYTPMSDYQAILDEEFEVLESIFPEELEKISDRQVRIRVEPDDPSSSHPLTVHLVVAYPETYPDVIPDLSFENIEDDEEDEDAEPKGELSPEETTRLVESLNAIAEESLGMAMTFTIASAAREALSAVIADRIRREKEEDDRKTREYEEAEAARTRGTPLTPEAFNAWRKKFTAEMRAKKEKEEEDRVKALSPKEREEYRRKKERPTGKQLFETSQTLATSDEAMYEDGAVALDMSQYTREQREAERRREEEEEEKQRLGLVGDGNESD
ncbi:ubiquitin-conjugating enzyme/RWD-like protein, partial [Papiliotrema laurentii]